LQDIFSQICRTSWGWGATGHFLGILDQLQPAIEKRTVKLLNSLEKQLSPMWDDSFGRRSSDLTTLYMVF
jgi:hypothetical protein